MRFGMRLDDLAHQIRASAAPSRYGSKIVGAMVQVLGSVHKISAGWPRAIKARSRTTVGSQKDGP